MKLLRLHLEDGRPYFINPQAIAAIWPDRIYNPKAPSDGKPIGTFVQMVSESGDATKVQENADTIVEAIQSTAWDKI